MTTYTEEYKNYHAAFTKADALRSQVEAAATKVWRENFAADLTAKGYNCEDVWIDDDEEIKELARSFPELQPLVERSEQAHTELGLAHDAWCQADPPTFVN
jgi:hypothetical protein